MPLFLGYNYSAQKQKGGYLKCSLIQSSLTAKQKKPSDPASITFSLPLQTKTGKGVIIDDSPYERDRSKKVELLSWIFDHNRRIMKRAETDKPNLKLQRPALYSTHYDRPHYDLRRSVPVASIWL